MGGALGYIKQSPSSPFIPISPFINSPAGGSFFEGIEETSVSLCLCVSVSLWFNSIASSDFLPLLPKDRARAITAPLFPTTHGSTT